MRIDQSMTLGHFNREAFAQRQLESRFELDWERLESFFEEFLAQWPEDELDRCFSIIEVGRGRFLHVHGERLDERLFSFVLFLIQQLKCDVLYAGWNHDSLLDYEDVVERFALHGVGDL